MKVVKPDGVAPFDVTVRLLFIRELMNGKMLLRESQRTCVSKAIVRCFPCTERFVGQVDYCLIDSATIGPTRGMGRVLRLGLAVSTILHHSHSPRSSCSLTALPLRLPIQILTQHPSRTSFSTQILLVKQMLHLFLMIWNRFDAMISHYY
jgi:hypothetical protein